MDELLKKVADIRGMPASLIERSAKARAEKTGTTLQAVLEEWAGEADESTDAAPPEEQTAASPDATTDAAVTEEKGAEQQDGGSVSIDDLVQMAADAKRMPPKLILSSAQARATHSGSTLEAVLADWAGVDLDDLQAAATEVAPDETVATEEPEPTQAAEVEPSEKPEPPAATVAAATVATAMSMDELLEKVAEAKGMPASLAKRSAEAKAKKSGEPLEVVLAEWAGVDVSAVTTAPPTADAEVKAEETAEPAPTEATDSSTGKSDETSGVEVIEPAGASSDDKSLGDGDSGEDADQPTTPRGGYPRWLAAAFLLIPLLAVTYLMVSPNGPDCGSGGQLLVDPVTGEATNCDGSEYGETTADFFAAGGAIYAQCAACHGSNGTGGVGPAFTSGAVLETFPIGQCNTQIEWIGIGTAGWPDSTYGANAKPVGGDGLMPGFAASLSEQQLAEVALFERVQFGDQDLADAEIDCGLVEASAEG